MTSCSLLLFYEFSFFHFSHLAVLVLSRQHVHDCVEPTSASMDQAKPAPLQLCSCLTGEELDQHKQANETHVKPL